MAVVISASIDGTSYNDITKIITGGKTINLSGVNEGSDLPSNVAQIVAGTYTQESDSSSTKSFTHGCSGKPDIIIVWSDFKTRYTSSSTAANTTIVGMVYNAAGGMKGYCTVAAGYAGTDNPSSYAAASETTEGDGHITNVGDSTFDVLFKANRRLGGGLVYQWLAIRLA